MELWTSPTDRREPYGPCGKHQDPWGQSSRHRRLNIQTLTSNVRSPVRRKTVSPFDPTDLGAFLLRKPMAM